MGVERSARDSRRARLSSEAGAPPGGASDPVVRTGGDAWVRWHRARPARRALAARLGRPARPAGAPFWGSGYPAEGAPRARTHPPLPPHPSVGRLRRRLSVAARGRARRIFRRRRGRRRARESGARHGAWRGGAPGAGGGRGEGGEGGGDETNRARGPAALCNHRPVQCVPIVLNFHARPLTPPPRQRRRHGARAEKCCPAASWRPPARR